MVDTLDILTLHLIWKFSNMSTAVAAADEAAKEKLRMQRDWLLERMVDYTSGGDSTVCEDVKKTVKSCIARQEYTHLTDDTGLSTCFEFILPLPPCQNRASR